MVHDIIMTTQKVKESLCTRLKTNLSCGDPIAFDGEHKRRSDRQQTMADSASISPKVFERATIMALAPQPNMPIHSAISRREARSGPVSTTLWNMYGFGSILPITHPTSIPPTEGAVSFDEASRPTTTIDHFTSRTHDTLSAESMWPLSEPVALESDGALASSSKSYTSITALPAETGSGYQPPTAALTSTDTRTNIPTITSTLEETVTISHTVKVTVGMQSTSSDLSLTSNLEVPSTVWTTFITIVSASPSATTDTRTSVSDTSALGGLISPTRTSSGDGMIGLAPNDFGTALPILADGAPPFESTQKAPIITAFLLLALLMNAFLVVSRNFGKQHRVLEKPSRSVPRVGPREQSSELGEGEISFDEIGMPSRRAKETSTQMPRHPLATTRWPLDRNPLPLEEDRISGLEDVH